jgi:hypothetical protein
LGLVSQRISGLQVNTPATPGGPPLQFLEQNTSIRQRKHYPNIFTAAPNEWYRWQNDLRLNQNIEILLSIDSSSFPLGTGPKSHEIWHSGYYPVVWTNKNYRMIYFNMGHNDMDYESGSNQTLSRTFSSPDQNKLILNSLIWLADKKSAND